MADIKTPEERSRNMAAIKSKDTKPEMYVRKLLFSKGYRYRVAPKYICGHPDIFLRRYNTTIFIHGCYWHRHVGCRYTYTPKTRTDFWQRKFETNILRDQFVRDPLFVFDLDSTITKCELLPLIAESVGLGDKMLRLTEAAMSGNVPFEQDFRNRAELLKQVSLAQARSIAAKQPLHERISHFIRENSQRCMILTGNLDVWIEPILEDLGMRERCICSQAAVCNGHVRKIAYIPNKGKVCERLQRPFIAIGDGSNDIEMLKTADIGIAFGGVRALSETVIRAADVVIMDENELISYLTSFL